METYYSQVVSNTPTLTTDSWITTSTSINTNINFGHYQADNNITIFSEDVDMKSINVQKETHCISIQILANGLVEEDVKIYTIDGKLIVEILEEECEECENEIIFEGFSQPCGKIEFEFSHLYDYCNPKVDLILGILFISVLKFEYYLKKEIQF